MFKLPRVLFVVAASSVGFTAAFAQTTYDDFKTNWNTLQFGSGTASKAVRNRFEVTLNADARSEGSDFFARGLSSTCAVSGNFDLRVSYRLLDWSTGNGVRTALYLGNPAEVDDESKGVFLERDSYSLADGGPLEVYIFFAGDVLQEVETAHTSGQLRLARVGAIVTGYYRQGTQWVVLSSTHVGTQNVRFAILVYSHDSVFADTRVRAAFDDVILAAGSFKGATCPFALPIEAP